MDADALLEAVGWERCSVLGISFDWRILYERPHTRESARGSGKALRRLPNPHI